MESQGTSAKEEDINKYLKEKYDYDIVKAELRNSKNNYHIIYYNKQPAGYSKIILNEPSPTIQLQNVTKLERLYLLKEFYGLKLGSELFSFNVHLSRNNNQAGMWLYVWKENDRAIRFYKKAGFEIIGSYDFKISATHSNPNHLMLLTY
ncbi:MAG TPA: GNAT family N-acetyltransferase [Chitinophagaceae bacterium]|nr:GNAT family N-acetyltransferase [Chitinophagaceae bacterium]